MLKGMRKCAGSVLVFSIEPCEQWCCMVVKMWFGTRAAAEDYARVAWMIGFGLDDAQGRPTGTHIAPSQIKSIHLLDVGGLGWGTDGPLSPKDESKRAV